MCASYKERGFDVDEEIADYLIDRVQDDPAKPWTIVSDVSEGLDEESDVVWDCLRKITLEGRLTPDADGCLRVME